MEEDFAAKVSQEFERVLAESTSVTVTPVTR
jgi:hypothetical protein